MRSQRIRPALKDRREGAVNEPSVGHALGPRLFGVDGLGRYQSLGSRNASWQRASAVGQYEAAATERALREDASPDRLFVQVRGSKRATRRRKVPIVARRQRELLDLRSST